MHLRRNTLLHTSLALALMQGCIQTGTQDTSSYDEGYYGGYDYPPPYDDGYGQGFDTYDGPMRPASVPQSSTIHMLPENILVAIDADHDAIVFMRDDVRKSVPACSRPAQMAWKGERLVVTCTGDRSLAVFSVTERVLLGSMHVGVEPHGVAFLDENRVVVALQGEDALAIVDVNERAVVRKIALPDPKPRSVAVDAAGNVVVSRLLSAVMTQVNPGTGVVTLLASDGNGGSAPTAPGSVTLDVDGTTPHLPVSSADAEVPTYYAVPNAYAAVRSTGWYTDGTFYEVTDAIAVALLDGAHAHAILSRGSRKVLITAGSTPGSVANQWNGVTVDVGHGADGLTVSDDGTKLYVHNAFDLTVTTIDVGYLTRLRTGTCSWSCAPEAPPPATLAHITEVTLPDDVRRGRELFFDSTLPQLTTNGLSCNSCHVEGRIDGRTWNAPNGKRNTPSLAGARPGVVGIASTTAPLHWDGELATPMDLSLTVDRVMHGDGASPEMLRALVAYIDTIPVPDSAVRGALIEDAELERGRAIFESEEVGCTACHSGDHHTDNVTHPMHDGRWQTPVLDGLAWTAPYLHDGSAATIEDLLRMLVKTDKMGAGSALSDDDLRALAKYLKSL